MGLIEKEKQKLIQQLHDKWKSLHWPMLPASTGDLYPAACKLMELDTYVAGCIYQVIETGKLEKNLEHILTIDVALTGEISDTKDPKTSAFLKYKLEFDDCIELARKILGLDDVE